MSGRIAQFLTPGSERASFRSAASSLAAGLRLLSALSPPGWDHDIEVEALLPNDPGRRYPLCTDGGGACPPEDCGGTGGFPELLEVLADPDHEEHESMLEWVGGAFDPERFDLVAVNESLSFIAGR